MPQNNRQGQIILELSFLVYLGQAKKGSNPTQEIVNKTIEFLAPDAAAKEIGNVFRRLIHFID